MNKIKHQYTPDKKLQYNYKWLNIYALKWIHEHIAKYISTNFDKDIEILVLWAGNWALDSRIYDYWFKNITAVDINWSNYKFNNATFIQADLNEKFDKLFNKKFDLIIAVEIIEHLFNPYNFLIQISNILKKDWQAIITTPNIHSWYSRVEFLINWTPKYFHWKPDKFEHISPISYWVLQYYSDIWNFNINKCYSIIKWFNLKNVRFLTKIYLWFLYILVFLSKIVSKLSWTKYINKISNWNILVCIINKK